MFLYWNFIWRGCFAFAVWCGFGANHNGTLVIIGGRYKLCLCPTFLYKSLKLSDASDVAPAFGAVSAVATLGFSFMFLGGSLSGNFLYGFVLLVVGTFITSYFHLTKKATLFLIVAGIMFSFSTVFLKELF